MMKHTCYCFETSNIPFICLSLFGTNSVFSQKSANLWFWLIVITGTDLRDSKLYDPPEPNGQQVRGCPPPYYLYLCFASLCMQPNIWTPPWANCTSLTSKGKAHTEAHRDDFSPDRTSSKHLARTLFWSPVLLYLTDENGRVQSWGWKNGWQQLGTKAQRLLF